MFNGFLNHPDTRGVPNPTGKDQPLGKILQCNQELSGMISVLNEEITGLVANQQIKIEEDLTEFFKDLTKTTTEIADFTFESTKERVWQVLVQVVLLTAIIAVIIFFYR